MDGEGTMCSSNKKVENDDEHMNKRSEPSTLLTSDFLISNVPAHAVMSDDVNFLKVLKMMMRWELIYRHGYL